MRILCLGNGDNLGVRAYSWFKDAGHNVHLYRTLIDEDPNRGNPYFYLKKEYLDKNSDIHSIGKDTLEVRNASLFGNDITAYINNNFDIVIITGGWFALLYSRKINLPKIFVHVGYEIHTKAKEYRGLPNLLVFLESPRQTLRNHFYGWLTRSALSKTNKILDWFPPTVKVNESLGFSKKIVYMALGEDIKRNKSFVKQGLLTKLNFNKAKRVFLWLSRINFLDQSKANYKGADLFIKALEKFKNELESDQLSVYMGQHGEEIEQFKAFVEKSPVYPYINWVEHLDYPDLITYLSINNAVLFTDFGAVNAGISGIGRDGYSVGIPMVNSTREEIMIKQYTVPGPRLFAETIEDIVSNMSKLLKMSDEEFTKLKEQTAAYGNKYIDKSFYIKRLVNEMQLLIK